MAIYMHLSKEIFVTVANKVGVLADMTKITAELGINILAVAGYAADNNEARIMLITSDNPRVMEALKSKGYNTIKENEVILLELENKPGILKNISATLAKENIDIKYIYGATCPAGCPAQMVISTSDNKKAMAVLR